MTPAQDAPRSSERTSVRDMSALAIQPVQTVSAVGGPSGPAPGAGGFDVLLAAVGSQDASPTTTDGAVAPTLAAGPDGGLLVAGDPLAETPSLDVDAVSDELTDSLVANAPDIAAGPAPALVQVPTSSEASSAAGSHTAPAWGRDKTAGLPAATALANASPNAAFLRTEDSPDAPSAPKGDGAGAVSLSSPAPGEPPRQGRVASAPPTPAANVSATPAAASTPDSDIAAASPPGPPEPAPTIQATTATPPATTTAALVAPPRAEPAPRAGKSDRARAADGVDVAPPGAGRRIADGAAGPRPVQAAEAAVPTGAEPPRIDISTAATDSEDPIAPMPIDAATADAAAIAPSLSATAPVRGAPETVANLAAHILKKLEGRSTRFDVELDPAGLGKVDVRIEIGAHGRMTAAMTFDNPQAAQDLKARSNELRQALEQAGFDLSGGLTFDVARDGGGRGQQAWQDAEQGGQSFRGHAFRAALDSAIGAADSAVQGALRLRQGVNAGLDLRI